MLRRISLEIFTQVIKNEFYLNKKIQTFNQM